MHSRRQLVAWFLPALWLFAAAAPASTFESLLMPGEVIEGHAKYEHECQRCHVLVRDKGQQRFCLDCHKEVRADVEKQLGFHGRNQSVHEQECQVCHTEHKGRNADIVKLNEPTFDHRQTDFDLTGAHRGLSCTTCHKAKTKHRDAPSECVACHKDVNPHRGRLGQLEQQCNNCHAVTSWNSIMFDHARTEFALTGKHESTLCAACHPNDRVDQTPRQCVTCHRINDSHSGRNGNECKKCHGTKSWKTIAFDHDKDTDFVLRGRHAKARCEACHFEDPYKVETKRNCHACHEHDDEHKGRYGRRCETCHRDSGWATTAFDHQGDTKFALKGKHLDAPCDSCHLAHLYERKLPTACHGCHDLDDAHKTEQGEHCEQCHGPSGWRAQVRFDHDVTHFPLIGIHAAVACEECHLSTTYKQTQSDCRACHKQQDPHTSQLGTQCERCHTPNGWQVWRFDHNLVSDFHIDGAHEKVHCHDCHFEPVAEVPHDPRTCLSCHRRDDAHHGEFGPRCDRCHTTSSFKSLKLRQAQRSGN